MGFLCDKFCCWFLTTKEEIEADFNGALLIKDSKRKDRREKVRLCKLRKPWRFRSKHV